MRRKDSLEPEITVVMEYLWFWSYLSVPEKLSSSIRSLSPKTKIVILTDDLHYIRQKLINNEMYDHLTQAIYSDAKDYEYAIQKRELSVYANADHVIGVTEYDTGVLSSMLVPLNVPVSLVRFRHNLTKETLSSFNSLPTYSNRKGICFLGNGNNPTNQIALNFFFKQVYPLVFRQTTPTMSMMNITFHLVGTVPQDRYASFMEQMTADEKKTIDIIPFLNQNDLVKLLQRCRVMIAPIRATTGVNTKIIYVLMAGIPVVTTNIGARGIDIDEKPAALAIAPEDTAQSYADTLIRTYSDAQYWTNLLQNSLRAASIFENTRNFEKDLNHVLQQLSI
ncbi:unnamed protein product [Didymodactylos carnosus]|uniref:Glycosyltransferase n=1 Tax=Didymodactylos carnosus TaxID=1234261 RepID=A0A8S2QW95_9BILA|nr:unnamed protein product [Didymodactylos carnosus]CAF4130887.1 unnamed protein product [Didymodactylos carnosus]